MFNQFAKHEDAFRDWRRDGLPGLKPDSYEYIEFLTSKDDDQAPRPGTLWPHQWEAFLRLVYAHEILGKTKIRRGRTAAEHRHWRRQDGDHRGRDRLAAHRA